MVINAQKEFSHPFKCPAFHDSQRRKFIRDHHPNTENYNFIYFSSYVLRVISLHKTMKFILFFVGVVYDSRVIHTVQQFFLLTTRIVRKFYISLNNTHLNNTR